MERKLGVVVVAAAALVVGVAASAAREAPRRTAAQGGTQGAVVKRGEYLVTISGCNDCHTPFKAGPPGPNGPEKDASRLLSGHPESLAMPPAPALQAPWAVAGGYTLTAWSGPWGVSFAANLTPEAETGLGRWSVQNFIEAMRTGRHQGRGRPILPPMPWQEIGKMSDGDLRAVFAYLRSIPPVHNRVPAPVAPAQAGAGAPGAAQGTGGGRQ